MVGMISPFSAGDITATIRFPVTCCLRHSERLRWPLTLRLPNNDRQFDRGRSHSDDCYRLVVAAAIALVTAITCAAPEWVLYSDAGFLFDRHSAVGHRIDRALDRWGDREAHEPRAVALTRHARQEYACG